MKQLRLIALVVSAIALFNAAPAGADPKTDEEARKFYDEAQKFYALGKFDKAIENYEKAYEISPRPSLLFNIAQAHRLNYDFKKALFFYQSFLRSMPSAPNKAEVDGRIQEMEEALKKQDQVANRPPNGSVGPGEEPGSGTKVPDPAAVAAGSAAGQDNASAPTGPADGGGGRSKPIYKKWWFWAGIGAVAAGAVAIVVVTSGGGDDTPSTTFGITDL